MTVSNDAGSKLEAVAAMSNSSSPSAVAGSAPVGDEAGRSAKQKHYHCQFQTCPLSFRAITALFIPRLVGLGVG
jgi:hypothetical protein